MVRLLLLAVRMFLHNYKLFVLLVLGIFSTQPLARSVIAAIVSSQVGTRRCYCRISSSLQDICSHQQPEEYC